ncbi:hypothetical protein PBY51_001141 [Eleginops maclovinus]|uniref:Hematopoietic progenitor cell antigen CD34 n=1 Tax=Eleginops maclovinus TaxID=56733 RepID=A0AAN7XP73_ELEMC|nr:hypothetical protein PBY51_001141 [Eleginops maclovinus]
MALWRMTCRRTAAALLLCTLLLSYEVKCQDATDAPGVTTDLIFATDAATPATSPSPVSGVAVTAADGGATLPSASHLPTSAPGHNPFPATIISVDSLDKILGVATAAPTPAPDMAGKNAPEEPPKPKRAVVPDVVCVGKEDVAESNAVKVSLSTDNCEETKRIIQENPAGWCSKDSCNLKVFQDGNTVLVSSEDANPATLADALKNEHLKEKLGVTKTETPSSSGSSVFVGILVSGLLAAAAITVGYLKCPRRGEAKGVRLAEEAYPADQENQGNTLASVAPLNPPPETPEKPSINGETPEAEKPEHPLAPTNGHSTTKTADTEL